MYCVYRYMRTNMGQLWARPYDRDQPCTPFQCKNLCWTNDLDSRTWRAQTPIVPPTRVLVLYLLTCRLWVSNQELTYSYMHTKWSIIAHVIVQWSILGEVGGQPWTFWKCDLSTFRKKVAVLIKQKFFRTQ
jgi:hypothetical protein